MLNIAMRFTECPLLGLPLDPPTRFGLFHGANVKYTEIPHESGKHCAAFRVYIGFRIYIIQYQLVTRNNLSRLSDRTRNRAA